MLTDDDINAHLHVCSTSHPFLHAQMNYLKTHFPEGSAFLMGPLTGDHWFVFVADYVDRPTEQCVDRTLDIMMFGLDEEVAKLFFKDANRFPKHSDVTKASGIDTLLPGSQIQEFCFDPCGYSMNGLLYDAYWTIHITPESHCSYASFETNVRMSNYSSLIKAVLAIFRPKKWTMTLFADEHGIKQLKESPFAKVLTIPIVQAATGAIMGPCVLLEDGNVSTALAGDLAKADAQVAAVEGSSAEEGSSTPKPVGSSSGTSSVPQKKGWLSYVSAHKTSSEFMGYSCFLTNYRQVNTVNNSVNASKLVHLAEHVPQAATEALSMPRAKYIVSKELEAVKRKQRTESM